jgi:hypothetical protein
MLGTVGSGKSTISAAIVLTAQTLSSLRPNFFCRVLENTSNILADASNLRRGRFPIKTNPYQTYPPESGLLMIWKGAIGEKRVQVPICDVAGEDIQEMIRRSQASTLDNSSFNANVNLINYVKDSDGFILAVPASRALIHYGGLTLEPEAAEMEVDPDVNLARILSAVKSHKDQSHGKPIKGIAVVITKWDLLAPYAQNWGMDLYDSSGKGLSNFMDICFPATSMELKAAGLDKVKFFPSHVQVAHTDSGAVKKWPDGSDMIETIPERRLPKYSEQSYVNLFEWLKTFAQ